MSSREAGVFVAVASLAFIGAAYELGRVCFLLSPAALAIVFWYSLAKRFTTYTQLFLALAMAVAPVGMLAMTDCGPASTGPAAATVFPSAERVPAQELSGCRVSDTCIPGGRSWSASCATRWSTCRSSATSCSAAKASPS